MKRIRRQPDHVVFWGDQPHWLNLIEGQSEHVTSSGPIQAFGAIFRFQCSELARFRGKIRLRENLIMWAALKFESKNFGLRTYNFCLFPQPTTTTSSSIAAPPYNHALPQPSLLALSAYSQNSIAANIRHGMVQEWASTRTFQSRNTLCGLDADGFLYRRLWHSV